MTDETTTAPYVLKQLTITIDSTQRPFVVAVPPDLSEAELLEIVSWMGNPNGLRQMLHPGPRIIVPFVRPS